MYVCMYVYIQNKGIQWTPMNQLDDHDFADNLALLSYNSRQMQEKTSQLKSASAKTGLKINMKKTKVI